MAENTFEFKEEPRIGANSEASGSYEQALRLLTPITDPGQDIIVEQLFTGYGMIKQAKVAFYPNVDVYSPKDSYIQHGLHKNSSELYVFGGEKHPFRDTGCVLCIGSGFGLQAESWDEATFFMDITNSEPPQILTETKQEEAPIKYVLKTRNSIKPGKYSLEFYFTYFNGSEWRSSSKKVDFKVRNFLERHDVLIGSVAILASLSVLIRFTFIPLISWLLQYFANQ